MVRFLTIFLCIFSITVLAQKQDKTKDLLANVQKFANGLQSYDMQLDTKITQHGFMMNVVGKVAGVPGKNFFVDFAMESFKTGEKSTGFVMICYDNNTAWGYNGIKKFTGKGLQKIDLTGLLLPDRPFDAYNTSVSGFMTGEDYPQTINSFIGLYSLKLDIETEVDGVKCFSFKGKMQRQLLKEYLIRTGQYLAFTPELFNSVMARNRKFSLFVRTTDYAPIAWEVSGDTSLKVRVLVKNLRINPKLAKNTFSLSEEITKGATDITGQVADKLKLRLRQYKTAVEENKKKK